MLGVLLMQVRDEIRQAEEPDSSAKSNLNGLAA
jgi:hypothetical protein